MPEPNKQDEIEQPPSSSEQETEEQARLEALYLEQLRRRSWAMQRLYERGEEPKGENSSSL